MKISEIIAAVENGAKWQYSYDGVFQSPLDPPKDHANVKYLCNKIASGLEVRLAPKKETVPLGPEDWDGIWFVRNSNTENNKHFVLAVTPNGFQVYGGFILFETAQTCHERSCDGKTWEPCYKTVEE